MIDGKSRTFLAGAAVVAKRLVKLSGAAVIHNTITNTDEPVGVSDYDIASGEYGNVLLLNKEGTLEVTASGAITAGADIYAAADGKASALPIANATYKKVGKALESAADGEIFEFLPYDYHHTTTV